VLCLNSALDCRSWQLQYLPSNPLTACRSGSNPAVVVVQELEPVLEKSLYRSARWSVVVEVVVVAVVVAGADSVVGRVCRVGESV